MQLLCWMRRHRALCTNMTAAGGQHGHKAVCASSACRGTFCPELSHLLECVVPPFSLTFLEVYHLPWYCCPLLVQLHSSVSVCTPRDVTGTYLHVAHTHGGQLLIGRAPASRGDSSRPGSAKVGSRPSHTPRSPFQMDEAAEPGPGRGGRVKQEPADDEQEQVRCP